MFVKMKFHVHVRVFKRTPDFADVLVVLGALHVIVAPCVGGAKGPAPVGDGAVLATVLVVRVLCEVVVAPVAGSTRPGRGLVQPPVQA